jgi:subtilase family protein
MAQTNFLIGRGELLTRDIKAPGGGSGKDELYTLSEAQNYLRPQFESTARYIATLPDYACPNGYTVAKLTLHPDYIAKSYFPNSLLRSVGLESIGSKSCSVIPRKWHKKGEVSLISSTELFVAGKIHVFESLSEWVMGFQSGSTEANDLAHIEYISGLSIEERFRRGDEDQDLDFYEIAIHLLPDQSSSFIQETFIEFAQSIDIEVHVDLHFTAGNIWFVAVEGEKDSLEKLASFSFIRVIRQMPKLRGVRPSTRTSAVSVSCSLPTEQPLSSEPKVAILDGGLPDIHPLNKWINTHYVMDPKSSTDPGYAEHGLEVTSAFLFGPIQPTTTAERPYSFVDNIRVLDENSGDEHPLELYRTLGFIEEVLLSRQYEFINLSLGPRLPIDDNDVHAWTSVIDELLSDGETFMTVAVGNDGDLDHASGNARIQVPADCVNAIAVGATNDIKPTWERADYSSIGPGRSPGVIKPDLMAFGGSASNYFHVIAANHTPALNPQLGTSYASPYLLRNAVGIRAILGTDISPLVIKALLVHAADANGYETKHVGWGKIPEDIMSIITCPSGVARIIYQGELKPGKYLRAQLPIPENGLKGKVNLKATFCYSCPVDPQDSSAYTRAGLDITFRPHEKKKKNPKSKYANSRAFFKNKIYATEHERRADGQWETVRHGMEGMLGTSLDTPVFDIHYNAREYGGVASQPDKIPYALVITVEAKNHPELYNEILRSYANILMPIQPQVSVPIRT